MASREFASPSLSASSLLGVFMRLWAGAIRLTFLTGQLLVVVALIAGAGFILSGGYSENRSGRAQDGALEGHHGVVESVAFSPDGQSLASCGWDSSVCLWDLKEIRNGSGVVAASLPHDSAQFAVAFSPDGALLAAAGHGSFTIWSRPAGHWEPIVDRVGKTYRCAAFAPNGRTLAMGCDDGSITLLEVPSGRERGVLRGHVDAVRSLAFAPDSRRLVSSGQDRGIMLWDTRRRALVRSLAGPGANPVQLVAFSPDGESIAVGEMSGNPQDVTLVDPETGQVRARLTGHLSGLSALAFAPDGHTLATASLDRCIKLWDLKAGKELVTLTKDVGWVKTLAFSPDGHWLAFAGNDATVRIWDLARQRSLRVGLFATGADKHLESAT
jgi:WD40 repeat protein